jgi:hypothetical protein
MRKNAGFSDNSLRHRSQKQKRPMAKATGLFCKART